MLISAGSSMTLADQRRAVYPVALVEGLLPGWLRLVPDQEATEAVSANMLGHLVEYERLVRLAVERSRSPGCVEKSRLGQGRSPSLDRSCGGGNWTDG